MRKHPTCPCCGGLLLVCQSCGQICDGNWRVCPVCVTPLAFHSAPAPVEPSPTSRPSFRGPAESRGADFLRFCLRCSHEERSAFLQAAKEEGFSGSEYADILINERVEAFEQGHPIPAATKGRQQRLQLCLHPQTMSHLKEVADKRRVSVSSLARAIFFFWTHEEAVEPLPSGNGVHPA